MHGVSFLNYGAKLQPFLGTAIVTYLLVGGIAHFPSISRRCSKPHSVMR